MSRAGAGAIDNTRAFLEIATQRRHCDVFICQMLLGLEGPEIQIVNWKLDKTQSKEILSPILSCSLIYIRHVKERPFTSLSFFARINQCVVRKPAVTFDPQLLLHFNCWRVCPLWRCFHELGLLLELNGLANGSQYWKSQQERKLL